MRCFFIVTGCLSLGTAYRWMKTERTSEEPDTWFLIGSNGNETGEIPKIHPAQKPVKVLKKLIETFTDPYDVVIDPCFGSGSTARACLELNRNFYGFEINKEFYRRAKEEMIKLPEDNQLTVFDL